MDAIQERKGDGMEAIVLSARTYACTVIYRDYAVSILEKPALVPIIEQKIQTVSVPELERAV